VPLAFEDYPFSIEKFGDKFCAICGSQESFLVATPNENGVAYYVCSDTDWCYERVDAGAASVNGGAR
jgi:alpha-D-ribose 1-methylphosphonate 5-phosphate C-P lyase